ncbi:ABC transporter substrate-binding protein [Gulosibacter molinativorax]|uniref:ABC transporter substrate-binding protein n=1 Tax=Gulosibacter molinativorax TaxID=256821 RepID=A0ABT7C3V6_9MICO|nr:ABC transporter substrate-binding protein [Gulosibacter molinativorax]MDJ1369919.1 ABC transporter substrate-binding protein [Gulosibacter molinativorax]QUY61888.1 Cystine-binding periplasmic protein [Gulosibacter molinativorax]
MTIRKRLTAVLPLLAAAGLALTACTNPTSAADSDTSETGGVDLSSANVESRTHIDPVAEAVDALEASGFEPINEGQLTVAISPYVAPLSFAAEDDPNLVLGNEADIAQLVADGLGLELNVEAVAWADWPLGVQSGKYDVVISNVTVTEERKDLFDFATYREDVLGFAVKAGSPIESITEAKDVAGLKIVVGSGTNQEAILQKWDEENVAAGLDPVEFVYYDDNAAAQLALSSGRVDALLSPNAVLAFAAAQTGETEVVGTLNGGWPDTANIGVTTAKGNGLIEPVQLVLQSAIEDGAYGEVIDRWSLQDEAIDESLLNPPGLPRP